MLNLLAQPSYDEEQDQNMIQKYNDLMNSDEQKKLRSWRRDSPLMKEWTKKEWDKFEIYFKEFPDGPNSNRLIAQKMGNGIHANHVAHYKRIYKKNKKENEEKKQIEKE